MLFERGTAVFRPREEAEPAREKPVRCLGISEEAPRLCEVLLLLLLLLLLLIAGTSAAREGADIAVAAAAAVGTAAGAAAVLPAVNPDGNCNSDGLVCLVGCLMNPLMIV